MSCAWCASSRHAVKRAVSQIVPDVGYQGTDCLHRFVQFGGGPADFPHPMPHFSRRVDVDTLWVGGTEQLAVIVLDCHRSKAVTAIAITSGAGTTTGGTNQANICFSCNRPTPCRAILGEGGRYRQFFCLGRSALRRLT